MRSFVIAEVCCALTMAVLFVGCAGRGNVELLEARLRDQEEELQSLNARVERSQSDLVAARRMNETLKKQLVQPVSHSDSTETAESHFRVTGLKINSLLTGGFNRDEQPGDDQLTVVFFPHDHQGQPIQLPGTAECELLDRSQPAGKQRLAQWKFDEEQLSASWQSVFGKPGYRTELPWQQAPTSADLEVRIRLRSIHGDQFETAASVTIALP